MCFLNSIKIIDKLTSRRLKWTFFFCGGEEPLSLRLNIISHNDCNNNNINTNHQAGTKKRRKRMRKRKKKKKKQNKNEKKKKNWIIFLLFIKKKKVHVVVVVSVYNSTILIRILIQNTMTYIGYEICVLKNHHDDDWIEF